MTNPKLPIPHKNTKNKQVSKNNNRKNDLQLSCSESSSLNEQSQLLNLQNSQNSKNNRENNNLDNHSSEQSTDDPSLDAQIKSSVQLLLNERVQNFDPQNSREYTVTNDKIHSNEQSKPKNNEKNNEIIENNEDKNFEGNDKDPSNKNSDGRHISSTSFEFNEMLSNDSSSSNQTNQTNKQKSKKFRCIECGEYVLHIYHTTKQGRLTLSTCSNCYNTCDKYVEYDFPILLLDLLLHKQQAVRHILFNYHHKIENGLSVNNARNFSDTWSFSKIMLCSVVLRACIYFNNSFQELSPKDDNTSIGYLNILSHTKDNVPIFYQFLMKSLLEMIIYILILMILLIAFILGFKRFRYSLMCILLSCFVNLGFAPMLIWDYSKLFQASIIILHWSMTVLTCSVVSNRSRSITIMLIVAISMVLAHVLVWRSDSPIKIANWGEIH